MKKILSYIWKSPDKRRVIYLPINKIDIKAKEKIDQALKNVNEGNTAAILLSINTKLPNSSHSLVYADQIGENLMNKTQAIGNGVKLITYAEDTCLGVGFQLLSYGDIVLSNPNSLLGNVGFSSDPWNLKEFSEYYQIKMRYIHKGKKKVRLNRFQDFEQEDIDWLMNIMNKRVEAISQLVTTKRASKFKNKDQTINLIKSGELFKPKQALELGLIDELTNPDEYVLKTYGKEVYIDVPQQNWKQKIGLQTFANNIISTDNSDLDLNEIENFDEQIRNLMMNYCIENGLRANIPLNI
ncbi:peptidase s49 [Stylonychia lemnae]|uniref:Peptidase s49 n=1 Tax=Stylonychia lemnae TaxID=5949 RepID=A0A078AYH1_STYLE|nr:peptidase s49 [Stylonychia lemnae]CDW89791.1 peptidase s49 [Stylonychia lemnae]|eukprot:CDW86262.1 peptidase s49 [Stylonychia lemnae]